MNYITSVQTGGGGGPKFRNQITLLKNVIDIISIKNTILLVKIYRHAKNKQIF